ncbi:MAG TPA: metal-dependent hydrolase [Thermoanaerobaculia bacterium]
MDPITHALAGAALAWAATGDRLGRRALLVGAAAALLPDIDVVIRSAADPLLAIEHHRGFTHALVTVPLGGALAALPFTRGLDRVQRGWAIGAGILAYLSHPLLDAATTYGTRLFWPVSRYRVGLDVISIVDPIFTVLVLIAAIAAFKARRTVVLIALALTVVLLAGGYVQRERATAAQTRVAAARGDQLRRGAVFPTIGNTLVWRSVYQTAAGTLRIDRIRVPWFGGAQYATVTSVPIVTIEAAGNDASVRRDFARFAWFSDDWLARAPADATVIGDARYSLRNDRYDPVWGIRLHPGATPPIEWVNRTRKRDLGAGQLWREVTGQDPALRPVP